MNSKNSDCPLTNKQSACYSTMRCMNCYAIRPYSTHGYPCTSHVLPYATARESVQCVLIRTVFTIWRHSDNTPSVRHITIICTCFVYPYYAEDPLLTSPPSLHSRSLGWGVNFLKGGIAQMVRIHNYFKEICSMCILPYDLPCGRYPIAVPQLPVQGALNNC